MINVFLHVHIQMLSEELVAISATYIDFETFKTMLFFQLFFLSFVWWFYLIHRRIMEAFSLITFFRFSWCVWLDFWFKLTKINSAYSYHFYRRFYLIPFRFFLLGVVKVRLSFSSKYFSWRFP